MTSSDGNAGFEEAIRSSWTNESIVKILGENNCWVIGHVITVAQDWLYCLLEDGNSKKINRWDPCIQPVMNDDDEFNDELVCYTHKSTKRVAILELFCKSVSHKYHIYNQ